MKGRRLLALSVLAIALACKDQSSPTEPRVLSAPTGPAGAISDGAHDGNPDFFFLPPMVSNPVGHQNYEAGRFNDALGPRLTIEICRLQSAPVDANGNPVATDCATGVPLVKKFDAGTVQLQGTAPDGHYQAQWNTRESILDVTSYYRIKILVEGSATPLGFADIDPMENKSQLKNARTGELIALIDDSTLPIKFRVEKSALCNPGETLCTSTIVTNHTPDGEPQIVRIFGADGSAIAGVLIPDGFLPETGPQSVVLTIDRVNTGANDVPAGTQAIPCHANLPLQQFNSCFHFSTIPELAAINEEGHQFLKQLTVAVCFVLNDMEDPREPWVQLWSSEEGGEDTKPLPSASATQILAGPGGEACGENLTVATAPSNGFVRLASAGWKKVKGGLGQLFGVKTAYAVDVGLGGLTWDMSNIGPALTAQIQRYTATDLTLGPGATTTSTARIVGTRVHNDGPLTTGIGGLPVTFTVAANNGSLKLIGSEEPGASQVTSITNTNPINPESPTSGGGFAPVNWTLPTVPGTYTLTATGPATGGPITFTATVPESEIGLNVISGPWVNENPETGGIVSVNMGPDEEEGFELQAFGNCSPWDCDWGVTSANTTAWTGSQQITGFWDQGFATRTQTITYLSSSRIQVVTATDFTEADGRPDYTLTEFFERPSLALLGRGWVNTASEGAGITRVSIGVEGTAATVQAWGSCQPTDCDWGVATANTSPWNSSHTIIAVWEQGYATRTMAIQFMSFDFVWVRTLTDFTEEDGRPDYVLNEYFRLDT